MKSFAGQFSLVITYLNIAYSIVQARGIAREATTGTQSYKVGSNLSMMSSTIGIPVLVKNRLDRLTKAPQTTMNNIPVM